MRFVQILFLLMFSSTALHAYAANEDIKIVLHVNDGFKLGHMEKSVKNIRKEMGEDVEIQVVINGNAVTRLLRSNKSSTRIVQEVLKLNAPIGLCHNAVNNNQVKKEMLIDGLEVLKTDGNVTVLNYQKQGYFYIKL